VCVSERARARARKRERRTWSSTLNLSLCSQRACWLWISCNEMCTSVSTSRSCPSRQHTSAYVSIRQSVGCGVRAAMCKSVSTSRCGSSHSVCADSLVRAFSLSLSLSLPPSIPPSLARSISLSHSLTHSLSLSLPPSLVPAQRAQRGRAHRRAHRPAAASAADTVQRTRGTTPPLRPHAAISALLRRD
jgi:hypothetical protein